MAIARGSIVLPACGPFDLRATVLSHPGHARPPWRWVDGATPLLSRVERLAGMGVYLLRIRPIRRGVVLRAFGRDADEIEVLAPLAVRVRRALHLDDDLRPFLDLARTDPTLRLAARHRFGRLLRGTSLWEDVVTTIVAAAGDAAVAGVARLGSPCPADRSRRAFPTPEQIARAGDAQLADRVGLGGTRAAALQRLAHEVAAGRIDLDALDDAAGRLGSAALRRRLRALPGVDATGAAWLLLQLGRPTTSRSSGGAGTAWTGLADWTRRWLASDHPGARALFGTRRATMASRTGVH